MTNNSASRTRYIAIGAAVVVVALVASTLIILRGDSTSGQYTYAPVPLPADAPAQRAGGAGASVRAGASGVASTADADRFLAAFRERMRTVLADAIDNADDPRLAPARTTEAMEDGAHTTAEILVSLALNDWERQRDLMLSKNAEPDAEVAQSVFRRFAGMPTRHRPENLFQMSATELLALRTEPTTRLASVAVDDIFAIATVGYPQESDIISVVDRFFAENRHTQRRGITGNVPWRMPDSERDADVRPHVTLFVAAKTEEASSVRLVIIFAQHGREGWVPVRLQADIGLEDHATQPVFRPVF
ncbi:MAG: hypothetical protein EA379_12295 [Phycisphaerales bacterium]|nr:MAG: hypothetical protein EA379_12295 [Phycisphaerales bacterium]